MQRLYNLNQSFVHIKNIRAWRLQKPKLLFTNIVQLYKFYVGIE